MRKTERKANGKKGSSSSTECPDKGLIWLTNWKTRSTFVLPTRCKSWDCAGCRDRKKRMVTMVIQYGISAQELSHLVTLTYKTTGRELWSVPGNLAVAQDVSKDFKALLGLLKLNYPNLTWFRVNELTKRGMIHLHLVIGGMNHRTRCNTKKATPDDQNSTCCLNHHLRKLWLRCTGDSYVVDVRRIMGAAATGAYLAKYMMKGGQRTELESMGFKRRYSCSRNWPRGAQMRRRGTIDKQWDDHGFKYGSARHANPESPLMDQMGDDLAQQLSRSNAEGRAKAIIKEIGF